MKEKRIRNEEKIKENRRRCEEKKKKLRRINEGKQKKKIKGCYITGKGKYEMQMKRKGCFSEEKNRQTLLSDT